MNKNNKKIPKTWVILNTLSCLTWSLICLLIISETFAQIRFIESKNITDNVLFLNCLFGVCTLMMLSLYPIVYFFELFSKLRKNKTELVVIKKCGMNLIMLFSVIVSMILNVSFFAAIPPEENAIRYFLIPSITKSTIALFLVNIFFIYSFYKIKKNSNFPIYNFILVNGDTPNQIVKDSYEQPIFSHYLPETHSPITEKNKSKKNQG